MITAVADTHLLLWMGAAPRKLGRAARRLLTLASAGRALILVPTVALLEIADLEHSGHIRLAGGFDAWVEALFACPGFQPAELTAAVVRRSHQMAARPLFSGRPPVGRAAAGTRLAATRARSAQGASKLPRYAIRDRMDRVIAATAAELECPLLTRDAAIVASGLVRTVR